MYRKVTEPGPYYNHIVRHLLTKGDDATVLHGKAGRITVPAHYLELPHVYDKTEVLFMCGNEICPEEFVALYEAESLEAYYCAAEWQHILYFVNFVTNRPNIDRAFYRRIVDTIKLPRAGVQEALNELQYHGGHLPALSRPSTMRLYVLDMYDSYKG
jgi:hypothetical protein